MNQLAVREQEFKQLIFARNKQIKSLLGDPQKVKRFSAVLLSASMDHALSRCAAQSVIEAGLGAAMLGLSPDKQLGQAYLVPYKTKSGGTVCQLQIGYRGYIALLERIKWHIKAYPVYSCDDCTFEVNGWEESFTYRPNYDSRQSDPKWVYQNLQKIVTIAKAPDGELFYNVMTKKEIEKIRIKSPSQRDVNNPSSIWAEWYEEMAIKSAIKRHIKRLPVGDEVAQSLALDDLAASGKVVNYEKAVTDGVIIESDISEPRPQVEKVDPNELLLQNLATPQPPADSQKQLFSMLSYYQVPDEKISQFIRDYQGVIESLIKDEAAISDLAAQLNEQDPQ